MAVHKWTIVARDQAEDLLKVQRYFISYFKAGRGVLLRIPAINQKLLTWPIIWSHNKYWIFDFPLGMFDASRLNHLVGYGTALVELDSGYRSYFRATVALHQNPNHAQEHQFQLHPL